VGVSSGFELEVWVFIVLLVADGSVYEGGHHLTRL
jgi:hypothetical protein